MINYINTPLVRDAKLQDALAAGERDGLLVIDRSAVPTTYRATFVLERCRRSVRDD
ncbi:hypothetical protein D3C85_1882770 [compost metagenome]